MEEMRIYKLKHNLYKQNGELCVRRTNKGEYEKLANHGSYFYFYSFNRKKLTMRANICDKLVQIELTYDQFERWFERVCEH